MRDGVNQIPIEQRAAEEIKRADAGWMGDTSKCTLPGAKCGLPIGLRRHAATSGTGLITERGICEPNETGIFLFSRTRAVTRLC